jgi:putative hemolysin
MRSQVVDPFLIDIAESWPAATRAAMRLARPLLSRALALDTYRDLYALAQTMEADTFWTRALQTLSIELNITATDLLRIPERGPLIVVANHPHGILDGLLLGDLLDRRRDDVRIVANHFVGRIPEVRERCIFLDPFGSRRAIGRNATGLRSALAWLDDGHALAMFPSGVVAHERSPAITPVDAEWRDTVGRLALKTGAAVVPVHIEGRNSDWFYRLGRVHRLGRTLLLARELLKRQGTRVTVRVGAQVALTPADSARVATARMRESTDALASERSVHDSIGVELSRLGDDARLLKSGSFEVFCARADEIPQGLLEIARLREITFRAVGEGTGHAIDLDHFDQHYLHLFVWDHETRQIAGAYRLGLTDEILATHGVGGLYTSTLFDYDARLLERMGPSLELGRSFVRAEYQRSNVLTLLWRGIAAFLVRSARYRVLFGPVSVSSRYRDTSQQLLRAFLAENFLAKDLAVLVNALTPPPAMAAPDGVSPTVISDVRELDSVIASLEADGKGIPVLLRQYLKLNAKLLGFNVDPLFGNALDALMMVDLADIAPPIVARFFGRAEGERLIAALTGQSRRAAA